MRILVFSIFTMMMSLQAHGAVPEIEEKVISHVATSLGVNEKEVSISQNLRQDLGAEDFDLWMLASDLEKEFDVYISEKEFTQFTTVDDIVNHIKKQKK